MFIISAIALVGLICVGVVLLGGILFTRQSERDQAAAVAPPEEPVVAPTAMPTDTPTASPTATDTPLPTPTGTAVVGNKDGQEAAQEAAQEAVVEEEGNQGLLPTAQATLNPSEVTPTNTLVVPRDSTPTPEGTEIAAVTTSEAGGNTQPPGQMPVGGGVVTNNNIYLAWAGVGILLVLLLGLVIRLKPPSRFL